MAFPTQPHQLPLLCFLTFIQLHYLIAPFPFSPSLQISIFSIPLVSRDVESIHASNLFLVFNFMKCTKSFQIQFDVSSENRAPKSIIFIAAITSNLFGNKRPFCYHNELKHYSTILYSSFSRISKHRSRESDILFSSISSVGICRPW